MGQGPDIALAGPQDHASLDAFLVRHRHSSLYLRAELRRQWMRPAFAIARENGHIVGAAAQSLAGMVLLQAPVAAGALAVAVLENSVRPLAGFYGPLEQVRAARRAMGLDHVPTLKDSAEDLFSLTLTLVRLPGILVDGTVRCRVAVPADAELLTAWRHDFRAATLNDAPGERLEQTSRSDIATLLASGSLFVLESDGPLACCSFNARLPDQVQVGNVWTPLALRGKGYGRAVVAGALAIARSQGVTEAILATGRHNAAAQAAYRAIGFTEAGEYATLILKT